MFDADAPILFLYPPTLGQSGSVGSMLVWVVVLLVFVFVGAMVIYRVRGQMLSGGETPSENSAGLLEHLRDMNKSGQLSDEEFAQARSAVLGKVQEDFDARQERAKESKPNIGGLDLEELQDNLGDDL